MSDAAVTDISAYDYELPEAAIAQRPADPRDSARLLDATGEVDEDIAHRRVSELPHLIRPGDLIVVNDTKVLPARLKLTKVTGGAAEVFLLEPEDDAGAWTALVRPSRRILDGTVLSDPDGTPVLQVGADHGQGRRTVTPLRGAAEAPQDLLDLAHRIGEVPLPPYISEPLVDAERYQTVYARHERSVAAPTAGLHLTAEVLDRCRDAGAELATVELAVGIGTFRPIVVDDIAEHTMHEEWYRVDPEVLAAAQDAERVIAIGTTTVRCLESAATSGEPTGRTELFIRPGYQFKLVDVLLTNFHQPRSSLLVMLSAFLGESWRQIYATALADDYRFLSFGDAMIAARSDTVPSETARSDTVPSETVPSEKV